MAENKSAFDIIKQILEKILPPCQYKDPINIGGRLHIIVKDKNGNVIDEFKQDNIVLNNGKQKVIESLETGSVDPVFRMAVGDAGASVGDPFQPLIPDVAETALYHEIYRKDIETITPGTHEIEFKTDFKSVDVPATAFQNQNFQVVNEALLVMGDGMLGGGDIYPPTTPDIDESAFAKRCFKSIPFESVNDITITIRWTIYIQ